MGPVIALLFSPPANWETRRESRQREVNVSFVTGKATFSVNFRASGKWVSSYSIPELERLTQSQAALGHSGPSYEGTCPRHAQGCHVTKLSILGASWGWPAPGGREWFPVPHLSPRLPEPTAHSICVKRASRGPGVRSVEGEGLLMAQRSGEEASPPSVWTGRGVEQMGAPQEFISREMRMSSGT